MKIPFLNRKKPPVIADPVRHAAQRFGMPFTVVGAVSGWEKDAAYHTTGEFAALENGFVRHCGPTAITNIIGSFANRGRLSLKDSERGKEVFRKVASIGRSKKFYWNTDVLRLYGGTFNMAAAAYIRAALKAYGVTKVRIRGPFPLTETLAKRSLKKGKLLYLELMFHPTYGNHHVICYGFRELKARDGSRRCTYLLCADGWNASPRYLTAETLKLCRFLEIDPGDATLS